ncbi:uncharacterized protein [Porites lutea]|uniref:uncharacterized protein n=1 Tax=Porites lutea TaxID=51062 RepID=UPI003CC58E21
MQVSDLGSPVSPQNLLAEHRQSSPEIDRLIQKAEFENLEQVKLIETERQRYAALLRQVEEKTRQVEELEKSTTQLDEEAKQLHKQFTQNREICESLKRTNSVLQEHEEALKKKKEMVLNKTQLTRLENNAVLEKYQAIWETYKTKYESNENAKELAKIKRDTMQEKEQLEEIRSTVRQLETGISSMETEKKKIQETIKNGLRSAIPVIIKLAQLNLETRKTVDNIQEVNTKVKHSREEQTRMGRHQNKSQEEVPIIETPETSTGIPVGTSFQLEGHSSSNTKQPQSDKNMDAEQSTEEDIAIQQQQQEVLVSERPVSQMQQLPTLISSQQSSKTITEDQVVQTSRIAHSECHPQQLQISHNQPSCSPQNMDEETTFPCTPTTAHQQNSGFVPTSEATNSPFNFEIHSNFIQQLRKSPGDGFLFQSRPMFDNSVEGDKEQANRENTNFLFNLQEVENFPTGSGADQFPVSRQNSNLFGSPVSGESRAGDGLFGTNPSTFNGCSIFGDPSPIQSNQQQAVTGPTEFSFSFGAKSPDDENSTLNRPAAFSLF